MCFFSRETFRLMMLWLNCFMTQEIRWIPKSYRVQHRDNLSVVTSSRVWLHICFLTLLSDDSHFPLLHCGAGRGSLGLSDTNQVFSPWGMTSAPLVLWRVSGLPSIKWAAVYHSFLPAPFTPPLCVCLVLYPQLKRLSLDFKYCQSIKHFRNTVVEPSSMSGLGSSGVSATQRDSSRHRVQVSSPAIPSIPYLATPFLLAPWHPHAASCSLWAPNCISLFFFREEAFAF